MAVRAYWKGSLKLSHVSCPVLLYPASTTSDKNRFPAKKAHRSAARAEGELTTFMPGLVPGIHVLTA